MHHNNVHLFAGRAEGGGRRRSPWPRLDEGRTRSFHCPHLNYHEKMGKCKRHRRRRLRGEFFVRRSEERESLGVLVGNRLTAGSQRAFLSLPRRDWKRLKGCVFLPPFFCPVPARGRRRENATFQSLRFLPHYLSIIIGLNRFC